MGCRKLELNDYFTLRSTKCAVGFSFIGNESDIQYSECQHRKDRLTGFSFTYDTNGSQIGKVNTTANESYLYTYNLQNRLATATINRMESSSLVEITSSYVYNQAGIRVRSNSVQNVDGVATTKNRKYLLDSGMTGYAQVLEEIDATNNSLVKSYTLGDDVLSQTVGGTTSFLQYDGHGSTRLLTDNSSAIASRFDYDAYGKNLFSANVTNPTSTDMLYSGEQFDPNLQMQYLRARYYDQNNGRFNRVDPFNGNMGDPQSLHKYAYCHGDPVMGVDPAGMYNLTTMQAAVAILTVLQLTMTVVGPMASEDMKSFTWAFPDAIIFGVQADARLILPIALAFWGEYWNLLSIPSFALLTSELKHSLKAMSGVVGVEIMLNVSSAQISLFVYGGAGLSASPGNAGKYGGLVFNTPHVGKYKGWFTSGTIPLIGSGFMGDDGIHDSFGASRDSSGSPYSAFRTFYHLIGSVNLPSMESTIPFAAGASAIATKFAFGSGYLGHVAAAASFLPWAKYKDPSELKILQQKSMQ